MNLARFLLTTLFVLSGTAFINAQENKCTLKIEQAPELRGFRLGMTVEQVKARVPSIQVQLSGRFGSSFGGVDGYTLQKMNETAYKNISTISFYFFDERVRRIEVEYTDVVWRNTDGFVVKLNQAFKLPNAWEGNATKLMQCDGWSMRASTSGNRATVVLIAPSVDQTLERRQAEYEEKQRQDFKP